MRILFVLENYYPKIGGVETLFKDLCEKLVEQGEEVQVLTSASKGQKSSEIVNGVHIHRIRIISRYLFTLLAFFPALRYAGQVDMIHCTSYNAALPAWMAATIKKRPVVITFHEVWGKLWFQLPFMSYPGKLGHYLFEKLLTRLSFDRFIAVSGYTAEALQSAGVDRNKVNKIYNGIEYKEFKSGQEKDNTSVFTYTYFGRLGVSKGLDILMGAVPMFRELYPDSRLQLIIPQEPAFMLNKIKNWIDRESLQDYVKILHELEFNDLKKKIRQSSCVVIPSYSEGFCFAAVESIALGVPVISSGKGALKEVVSGRYIVMPSHDAEGLVEALVKAYSGIWEESEIKRFDLQETVEAYLTLYRDL